MRSLHVRAESSIVGYGGSSSFLLLLPLFILKIFMKFGVITMGSTPPHPLLDPPLCALSRMR
jgi:hypothetical protein